MRSNTITEVIIARWQFVVATAFLLWSLSSFLILNFPLSYRAQALVVPAETTGISVSMLLSPLPVVSPAMFEPKISGNFAVYLGALRTREMAAALRRETSLADVLELEQMSSLFGRLYTWLGLTTTPVDDDTILYWLERNTSATQQAGSIVWIIEVRDPNPVVALDVLRTLHKTAEDRVRDEISTMVARRIAWLADRAATEPDAVVRNTLYDLMAQSQRHAAILASDSAVAARLVSAPAVENRPSVPNRTLLLALALIASILLSVSIWSLVFAVRLNLRVREVVSDDATMTQGRTSAE